MSTVPGSNVAAEKDAIFERIKEIGKQEGSGTTARMILAEYVTARARDGLLDINDAEKVWTEMSLGVAEVTKEIGGSEQAAMQRTSEIKHFITLGANKKLDGVELLDNAKQRMTKIRAAREDGKRGRVWNMLLDFARAQNKSDERALTNREIDKLFEQQIAEERQEVDILWGARNSLLKANEGVEDPKIQKAIELIDERVLELGGTKKQKLAAARKAAQDEERAKKAAAKVNASGKTNGTAAVAKVKRK